MLSSFISWGSVFGADNALLDPEACDRTGGLRADLHDAHNSNVPRWAL
jgi:hypothetical protein